MSAAEATAGGKGEPLAATDSPASAREALPVFLRHGSPRFLLALFLGSLALRPFLGPLTLWDAGVAVAIVLWWPVQEWALHAGLLHIGPFHVRGRTLDLAVAKRHAAHHKKPWRPDLVFLPMWVHSLAPAVVAVFWIVFPTAGLAGTAMAAFAGMALQYEWVHFLVHTRVWPRARFLQRLWRNHRLHHFKNESYWFGFTSVAVDRALGTDPEPKSVPTSPTARTLGRA